MFSVGQFLVVKITSISKKSSSNNKSNSQKHRVTLSTDPKDVHSNWTSTALKQGLTLTGAFKSELDHGWEVDLGINGVTAFLPRGKIGKKGGGIKSPGQFGIGQLLQVKVEKVTISDFRAVVQLSADQDLIRKWAIREEDQEVCIIHDFEGVS
jgi:hypothetical protein